MMQFVSHRLPEGYEMETGGGNWGWYALTEYRRKLHGQLSALKYTEKRNPSKIPYSPDTLFSLETLNFSNLMFKALNYKPQYNIISIMFFIHFSLIAYRIFYLQKKYLAKHFLNHNPFFFFFFSPQRQILILYFSC